MASRWCARDAVDGQLCRSTIHDDGFETDFQSCMLSSLALLKK